MATIKGQNIRILLGPDDLHLKCVAVAQSCTMHLQVVTGESSSKDQDDGWMRQEITAMNWDVEVDAIIATPELDAVNASDLVPGQSYILRMTQTATTSNTKNRNPLTNSLQLTGEAILTDLQFVAGDRQQATWSAKFIGDGDLTQYTPSS